MKDGLPVYPDPHRRESEPQQTIPGRPGYRMRDGRTGWDPIDTARESAYMEGRFFKALFTGRLRTCNPWYLTLMFVSGLILTSPLICSLVEALSGHSPTLLRAPVCLTVGLGVFVVMGIALFINLAINLKTDSGK